MNTPHSIFHEIQLLHRRYETKNINVAIFRIEKKKKMLGSDLKKRRISSHCNETNLRNIPFSADRRNLNLFMERIE